MTEIYRGYIIEPYHGQFVVSNGGEMLFYGETITECQDWVDKEKRLQRSQDNNLKLLK